MGGRGCYRWADWNSDRFNCGVLGVGMEEGVRNVQAAAEIWRQEEGVEQAGAKRVLDDSHGVFQQPAGYPSPSAVSSASSHTRFCM